MKEVNYVSGGLLIGIGAMAWSRTLISDDQGNPLIVGFRKTEHRSIGKTPLSSGAICEITAPFGFEDVRTWSR